MNRFEFYLISWSDETVFDDRHAVLRRNQHDGHKISGSVEEEVEFANHLNYTTGSHHSTRKDTVAESTAANIYILKNHSGSLCIQFRNRDINERTRRKLHYKKTHTRELKRKLITLSDERTLPRGQNYGD